MSTRPNPWLRLLCFDALDDAPTPLIDLPDDLTTLSDEQLGELLQEATERFDEVREGDLDAEAVANLSTLRDAIVTIRAEGERREMAAVEAQQAIEALVAEVHPPEAEAEAEGDPETPPEEPDEPETPEAEVEPDAIPELVSASAVVPARRPALGAVARHAPRPPAKPARLGITITAAADVPGLSTGARIATMDRVAVAVHDRARMLANNGARAAVCRIDKPIPATDVVTMGVDPMPVLDRVRDPQTLVASGGWCGPLEPLYNVCRIDAADGLLELPSVRVTRAGFQVPSPITMPTDLSTISWKWTNADDIAAAPPNSTNKVKPCITIPCPTWTPYELEAYGICVTHGNLMDRSFPELTREYLAMVMNAHMHAMSAQQIAGIEAASTAIAGPTTGSAASSIMSAAELACEFYREKYHMGNDALLEVILPSWADVVHRSDLAARAGVDLLAVTDAMEASQWAARDIHPQYVQDWQPLANATAWPGSMKMLIYPPGTWVKGDGGTLDLGVVRDSTLNATNDYTAAWTEDFWVLAKVCTESLVVSVPLSVDGVTACCA